MMKIREEVRNMKKDAPFLAASSIDTRNKALELIAENLKAHKEEIFCENKRDLEEAEKNGISPAVVKRLKFDEGKLSDVLSGIEQLIGLEDPLEKVSLARELDEGLTLYRISCPIGVIGVIFEARPDALVQISTLCIKSGNCAILKGEKRRPSPTGFYSDIFMKAWWRQDFRKTVFYRRSSTMKLMSCFPAMTASIF